MILTLIFGVGKIRTPSAIAIASESFDLEDALSDSDNLDIEETLDVEDNLVTEPLEIGGNASEDWSLSLEDKAILDEVTELVNVVGEDGDKGADASQEDDQGSKKLNNNLDVESDEIEVGNFDKDKQPEVQETKDQSPAEDHLDEDIVETEDVNLNIKDTDPSQEKTTPNDDVEAEKELMDPDLKPVLLKDVTNGINTVIDPSGKVTVTWKFDGGAFEGQLSIVSAQGLEDYDVKSLDFMVEAVRRATENIVVDDIKERAEITGWMNGENSNHGEFAGAKTVHLNNGERFFLALMPNGSFANALADLEAGKMPSMRPLFSIDMVNPEEMDHFAKLRDLNGKGTFLAIEDIQADKQSDWDFNDIIIVVEGAEVNAPELDELIKDGVISKAPDWMETELGKEILESEPDDPVIGADPVVNIAVGEGAPPKEHQPLVGAIVKDIVPSGITGIDADRIQVGTDHSSISEIAAVDPEVVEQLKVIAGNDTPGANPVAPLWVGDAGSSGSFAESLQEFVKSAIASAQPNAVAFINIQLTQVTGDGQVLPRLELTEAEYEALSVARDSGIIVVLPAGNGGGVIEGLPAIASQFDNVVIVGAAELNLGANRAEYSSIGDPLDLIADGSLSELSNGQIETIGSTQVAASRVTAAISQIWAANPDLTYHQVIDILKVTAEDINTPGWDVETGAGVLNIAAALSLAKITIGQPFPTDPSDLSHQRKLILGLPDSVYYALLRAENLSNYSSKQLAETDHWVIKVRSNQNLQELTTLFKAKTLRETGYIPNTYVLRFPKGKSPKTLQKQITSLEYVDFAYPLVTHQHETRFSVTDPLFAKQWHLKNKNGEDINVTKVWESGIKGNRVVVGTVDIGLQPDNPDLINNYRADLSRSFTARPGDTYGHDPSPDPGKNHGTIIGEIIAAAANDGTGGTGIAPKASLAGLKINVKESNDLIEADALSYLSNDIDIYNNSWGPEQTKKSPGPLTAMALHLGATQGRNGLGSIYVWAGGSHGAKKDNSNYDGYANSRYTIAVGAVDHNGEHPYYSELGASLLVSAYSSNSGGGDGIVTRLNDNFGGTSASAAIVSGVVALMLEANPTLTWRDVQEILIRTAKKNDPSDEDWKVNGAGYHINHKYGFGVVDAAAAVELAKNWSSLGTEVLISSGLKDIKSTIPDDTSTQKSVVSISEDITVETVEVMFDAKHSRRGDLEVKLISPSGTESILAELHSDEGDDYNNWLFTSTRHWGEYAKGDWRLEVTDKKTGETGTWNSWKLNLYGSKPTVSIKASVVDADEDGKPGEFTVTRTGNTEYDLTINYELGSAIHWSQPRATPGKDYQALPGKITIPAGQSSAKIPVISIPDQEYEWTETVTLKLVGSKDYKVSSTSIDTVKIWDSSIPAIQVMAENFPNEPVNIDDAHRTNYISESGNRGNLHFRRFGDIRNALDVYYSMTGTAINGVDYVSLPGKVTFAPGQWDLITRNPFAIDDQESEAEETAILTIDPSSKYTIFVDSKGKKWDSVLTIIDDNDSKPTVNIIASKPIASESGDVGQFTITRTGDTSQPLAVKIWEREWWLRAKPGIDYEHIPGTEFEGNSLNGTIIIPAGASSVTIDIKPIDDDLTDAADANERVRLFLRRDPSYAIGSNDGATVNIIDNDNPKVEWERQLGTPGNDNSQAVALDKDGNVYIAGRTSDKFGSTNNLGIYDAWLASYDRNGNQRWISQLGTNGYDAANGITVDSTGNVYVTGWTDGKTTNRDTWLAKYDSTGSEIWRKQFTSASNDKLLGYDIANGAVSLGSDGSIYLAGLTYGDLEGAGANKGKADAWVAKYSPIDGTQQWVRQLGTSDWDEAKGVVVDPEGNVYVSGQTRGALGDGVTNQGELDAWVAKYNSSGALQWKRQLGTQAEDSSQGIALTKDGKHIYLTGYTGDKLGEPFKGDPYELGYSNVTWAAIHGDKSGLGGTYYGSADAWVAQYDSNGNLVWKRQLGTPQYEYASGAATDNLGNVYITGSTRGKLGGNHMGGEDIWVAKYNSNGALQWKQQLGTTGEDVSNGIAVNNDGIYITGSTSGGLNGGANKGGDDAWLIKLS